MNTLLTCSIKTIHPHRIIVIGQLTVIEAAVLNANVKGVSTVTSTVQWHFLVFFFEGLMVGWVVVSLFIAANFGFR